MNNRGSTIIEILICFTIVAAIVTSMLAIVGNYKDLEVQENAISDINNYKNIVTQAVMNDIVRYNLTNIIYSKNGENITYELRFKKPVCGNKTTKKLVVVPYKKGDADSNYIQYDDAVSNTGDDCTQVVKYSLDEYQTYKNVRASDISTAKSRAIKITGGELEEPGVIKDHVFSIKIHLNGSDLEVNKYYIEITAPRDFGGVKVIK